MPDLEPETADQATSRDVSPGVGGSQSTDCALNAAEKFQA
jgi:hypothetical protein